MVSKSSLLSSLLFSWFALSVLCNEVIDKGKEKDLARDACAPTHVFVCL